ncbi:hypothetical protein RUK84_002896 [Vibrio cholerae]|uniref:hypothetical protein n=1 Tax=Vibrio fluvialis TaxID=676 RepID=UPI001BAFF1F1|nr:hypothetical protein [Vibrio fluvialis]ELJ8641928.1 hypothetical protein [Vibrio cholerae]ELY5256823.1 hypothetical protein [Vibrio cholerae]MCE7641061.1 hypothetical protein [Vibrio fluvialis]QUF67752.1 hypothetical protein KC397_09030 [Vibrio fluvialis]
MAKLTLKFEEKKDEAGEVGVYIGWEIEQGENQTMNELSELVKDLVYRELMTAMKLQGKQNAIH